MGKKNLIKQAQSATVELEHFFNEFTDFNKARNLSDSTILSYEKSYKRFIDWLSPQLDGAPSIESIDDKVFFRFINQLKQDMIKPASINHYLRDMRTFVNWLNENKHTSAPIKIYLVEGQEEEFKCYTNEDLMLLLAKPRKNESFAQWRTWAIVNWCLGTGNRAKTIRNVLIQDVDFKNKQIKLRHTKNKKASVPIPLSRELAIVLKEYISMFRGDSTPEEYLFCDISGELLSESALTSAISRYNTNRGVKNTSIHSLRHTFARQWLLNTGDVFRLQKILGHSSLEMTRRYVNLLGEDLKEDFEAFNPLDNLKKDRRHKVKANA